MASQIIVQQTGEAEARSGVVSSQSAVNVLSASIGNSVPGSSTVQRIVKTPSGTQIILSGVPNHTRTACVNVGIKRPISPDVVSQPPAKIKLTHSNSNSNIPIVTSVQNAASVTSSNDGVRSPQRIMHVTGSTAATGTHARRLVLSPVKGASGKYTMVPMSSSNTIKTVPTSGKVVNMAKTLTFSSNSIKEPQKSVPLSPQKFIIKGQDTSAHNLVIQQKAVNNSTGLNSTSNVQPVAVSGSKFQYVRLVSNNSGQSVTKATSVQSAGVQQHRTLAPSTAATLAPVKPPTAQLRTTTKSSHSTSQRLILPATSQVSIRPNISGPQYSQLNTGAAGGAQALTNLPPGTAIISSGQNLQGVHGVQGFALVPAQYVTQLQQQFPPTQASIQPSQQQALTQVAAVRQESNYVQLQQPPKPANRVQPPSSGSTVDGMASSNRPRKPCNCTKSQCLKLYCECFANGEFCYNCNCNNCFNNLEHEDERSRAIKACLDRNPNAFRPKIGKDKNVKGERRHNKGCNCKRSGCLKNYCECYEAKIMCSHLCKCVGCKNFEESPEKKTLMHLADAAEVRKQQQVSAKHKLSSQIQDLPTRPAAASTGHRLAYSFVTNEVAEATCSCLIAQAEETERTRQIDTIQEKLILEEFGRCLMQVIESANLTEPSTAV